MPRPRKTRPEQPNSLVSSAAQIRIGASSRDAANMPRRNAAGGDWQAEVWRFVDTVGELRFYAQYVANSLSKVRLYIARTDPDGTKKEVDSLTAPEPTAILDGLFGGDTGQSQMLATLGAHLSAPGESWLFGLPPDTDDPLGTDSWRVLSTDELKHEGGQWVVARGDGNDEKYPDKAKDDDPTARVPLVIRIWRSHPRMWVEADSPVRAALPILRELEGLTKHVAASIDSRLAGAGLLLLPSEMTFETPPADGVPADPRSDQFMTDLTEAMTAPIGDRGNASAVVPLVVRAPGAIIGNAKYITFATELSQQALDLRTEAIKRLALSLDVPPEVMLGQADSNHWSAWVISDDAIKIHTEPLVELITEALTTRFLWPIMAGDNVTTDPAVKAYTIEADTSALRQRPNKSADAQALHKLGVLSDAALLRETGFADGDLPGDDETKRRLLMAVAGGVTTADLTAAALAALGVSLEPKVSEVSQTLPTEKIATAVTSPAALPAPAADAPPADPRTPPSPDQAAALLAASEVMVLRAMERANNRANNRGRQRRPIPASKMDDALTGAWEHVERVAALTGVDPARLLRVCDVYTRTMLERGDEHDPRYLAACLNLNVLGDLDALRLLDSAS